MMESHFAGYGFGALKFVVVETNPKKDIVVVTPETEVEFNPKAVEEHRRRKYRFRSKL